MITCLELLVICYNNMEESYSSVATRGKQKSLPPGLQGNGAVVNRLSTITPLKYWNESATTVPKVKDKVFVMFQRQVLLGNISLIFADKNLGTLPITHKRIAGIDLGQEYSNLLPSNPQYGEKCKKKKLLFVRLCNCRPYREADSKDLTSILDKDTLVEIDTFHGKTYGIVTGWELASEYLHEDIIVHVEIEQMNLKSQRKSYKDGIRKYPIGVCSPDKRFQNDIPGLQLAYKKAYQNERYISPQSCNIEYYIPPILEVNDSRLRHIIGEWKGIQGHYNSCYLDTTLFSMFLFTDKFDNILECSDPSDQDDSLTSHIKTLLREEIVYPLRQTLFVSQDKLMKLRGLLQTLDNSLKGFETAQKDAEEFIEFFLQHVLQSEPLMEFESGQTSYCYQLFVDKSKGLELNTVQSLVSQSLLSTNTKFQQMPNCIFLLMPRHGSKYKTYDRIFPSKTIDIGDFIKDESKMCCVCGEASDLVCKECRADNWNPFIPAGFYCREHVELVHCHPDRQHHKPELCDPGIIGTAPVPREMDLHAIWCIETSHYIAFGKCGSEDTNNWYFFDSMAQRIEYNDGFNVPEVTECNELNEWLSEEGYNNVVNQSKQIPEKVKRLLRDVYICMYIKKDA